MRNQIVPHVLVVLLSTFAFSSAAFAQETAGDANEQPTQSADQPSRAPTNGTTTRGADAKIGVTAPDQAKMQAAVEKAADLCDDTADDAVGNCSDKDITTGKVSGEGLGNSDQSAALTRMTKSTEKSIAQCSPYARRCKAQCANLKDQMKDQCPTCNFASLTAASNKCGGANKTLANLKAQKDSFVADNETTKKHAKGTGEAGEDITGRKRSADEEPSGGTRNSGRVAERDIEHTGSLPGKMSPPDVDATGSLGQKNSTRSSGSADLPKPAPRETAHRSDDNNSGANRNRDVAARETSANHTADRASSIDKSLPASVDANGDNRVDHAALKKYDTDHDGKLSKSEMKMASMDDANKSGHPATSPGAEDHAAKTQSQDPSSASSSQPQSVSDDGKAERKAARREARQQEQMQQQMQTAMMQQSLSQMSSKVQAQQTQIAQQKNALSAQQAQAVLAATIAQQNALASTLAAQQAARVPASAGQAQFAMSNSAMIKRPTLNPSVQIVNAVTERPVMMGQPTMTTGGGSAQTASWTPNGAPVALAPQQAYDPAAHTNATQLNQKTFGAEEGGGAGSAAGGKARKLNVNGKPMSVAELTGDASPARTVAGMGDSEQGIQSSAVDIWGLVSQRFQARCSAGRLKDCH